MKKSLMSFVFILFFQIVKAQVPSSFYLDETSTGGRPIYTPDHIYFENNTKYVKTDYQGNIIWSKTDLPRWISFQGDVFYGLSYLANNYFYISKWDTAANLIWAKDISQTVCPWVGNQVNGIAGFIVNQDRIYISSGQRNLTSGNSGASALLTLDTSGNVIQSWCDPTMFPMTLNFISYGFPSFLPGGWIMFTHGGVGTEISLVKLNYDGTINTSVQTVEIDMGISVYIDDLLHLPDSTYLAVCRTDNNQMGTLHDNYFGLSKFTENGTVLWQKTFQTIADTGTGCNATCDSLGNIYLFGGLFTYTSRYYFGMKLDPNGNIDFMKVWNDSSIATRLEIFSPTFKDDHICCGIHYIDNNSLKHEGIIVFDTLFSSCMMNGNSYSISQAPNPVTHQFWPAYNAIAYNTNNDTLPTPVNNPPTFQNDLCSVVNVSQNEPVGNFITYPNPFSNSITIDGIDESTNYLKVFDLKGELVFETKKQDKTKLDLSFLTPGIYQLTIQTKSSVFTKKIVKI